MVKKNNLNLIEWNVSESLKKAYIHENNDNITLKSILDVEMNVKPGDKVCVVYLQGQSKPSSIVSNIKGTKLIHILKSIESGMNKTIQITNKNNKIVYGIASTFYSSTDRLKIISLYENKKLKPKDLLGDYVHYSGNLIRNKNGIWTFNLDN